MNQRSAIRIGVIADTHGRLDPMVRRHFKGVDYIFHAGDIGDRSVIEQLEQIAPVTAVSGNIDENEQSGLPSEVIIELAGRRIAMRHILYERGTMTKEGRAVLDRERPDTCIFGHTHQPKAEWFGKTLLFNPGSAGPKRFTLPRCLGIVVLAKQGIIPKHILLDNGLLHRAAKLTGLKEKTVPVQSGLETLIAKQSAQRLAELGGKEKALQPVRRRRSAIA